MRFQSSLYAPFQESKKKKGGNKKHPYFAEVDYGIGPVHPAAVWEGVVEKDAQWCYPEEGSYKMRLRQVRKQYSKWQKKAISLQSWILDNFSNTGQMKKFTDVPMSCWDPTEVLADIDSWLDGLDINIAE